MIGNAIGKRPFALRVPHAFVHGAARVSEGIAYLRNETTIFNREKAREMVQESWACSSEKAMRDFGYREALPLEERLHQTVQWYKTEGWL
jgi:nucleoside-diphosphate-sugar epimerase